MHGTLNIEKVEGEQIFVIRLYPDKADFDSPYHAAFTGIIKGNDFEIKGLSGKCTKKNFIDVCLLVFNFFGLDTLTIKRLNQRKLSIADFNKNDKSIQIITKENFYKKFRDS